jgi:triosephosphate isomerase
MSRKALIAANWKMYKTPAEAGPSPKSRMPPKSGMRFFVPGIVSCPVQGNLDFQEVVL